MTGRDDRGRFTRRNPYASSGGKARAARLTAEQRKAIARQGWQALVNTRFSGDGDKARAWLTATGLWAQDAVYRERGFGVFRNPGAMPDGSV